MVEQDFENITLFLSRIPSWPRSVSEKRQLVPVRIKDAERVIAPGILSQREQNCCPFGQILPERPHIDDAKREVVISTVFSGPEKFDSTGSGIKHYSLAVVVIPFVTDGPLYGALVECALAELELSR